MASNPWDAFPIVQPAGQAAPGPIVAPADPYKQAAEVRADASASRADRSLGIQESNAALQQQVTQLSIAERQDKIAERQQKQQAMAQGERDAAAQIRSVISAANEAKKRSGDWFATGFGANTARDFGGSSASDVAALLNTIGANTAFDRLQQMRAQSPTGGALGAVSDTELQLLRDSTASLSQSQSDEQFRVNMDKVIASYNRVLTKLEGGDPDATPATADQPAGGYDAEAGGIYGATTDDSPAPPTAPPTPGGGGNSYVNEIGKGLGSIVEGAAALPGMIINPIGQAMYDVLGYDQQYNAGDIVRGGLGLPNNEGMGDAVIQGATGALTGGLAARAASSITAPGAIRNALELVGRTPLRDTAAGAGAGAGAVLGEQAGGPVGGVVGALAGGVGGFGAANALSGVAAPRTMSALGQAAQRQNVDLLPADAGGAAVRGITGAARQSPLSAGPVARAGERQQGQMRTATRRIAEDEGNIADTQRAGEGVRNAAERYTKQTSERGGRLYERAGERARGVRIKPLQTINNLDAQIARVRENPAATPGMVDELVRFRENISNGVGVTGLRDARTTLSQGMYDGNLRTGPEKAMWKGILNDLSSDIDGGLRQAGRNDAARMFRQADEFWKGRVEHIDEVLQPILGKDRSGEDIVATVERMSRGQGGGNARLSRLLSAMTPEEAGNTRAVVIDRLGRSNPGAQNAEGSAYSAATFLTNWNKMTPQAKASLFDSPALRRDLNDIAQIAEGTKVGQSAANHSNTAGAIYGNIGAGAAIAYANPAAALIAAGGQYLTGRLMASPAFARLLAKTAKMPDRQAQRTFSQDLGTLAGREAIIASDIRSVMQYLGNAAAQSPGRLAANEQERD